MAAKSIQVQTGQKSSAAVLPGMAQSQMKNFITLKNKIIRTDEIIQRYKSRVCECEETARQLRETQAQLVAMENGVKGLKAELHALHQDKNQLTVSLRASLEESTSLRDEREGDERLIQQLKAQVDGLTLKLEKLDGEKSAQNYRKLNDEKEKWKNMYQKAKRDLNNLRERNRSRPWKSSPSSPLLSPPYAPVFEELPTPPLVKEEIKNEIDTVCKTEVIKDAGIASKGRVSRTKQVKSNSTSCIPPFVVKEEFLSDRRDSKRLLERHCSHEVPRMSVEEGAGCFRATPPSVEERVGCSRVTLPTSMSVEEGAGCSRATLPTSMSVEEGAGCSRATLPTSMSVKKGAGCSRVTPPTSMSVEEGAGYFRATPPTKDSKPVLLSDSSTQGECAEPSLSDIEKTTPTCPLPALSVKGVAHPKESPCSLKPVIDPRSAPPISLAAALFGESDSDDFLSVSEDSSDDEPDHLAKMLNSKPVVGEKAQLSKTLSLNTTTLSVSSVIPRLSLEGEPTPWSRESSGSPDARDQSLPAASTVSCGAEQLAVESAGDTADEISSPLECESRPAVLVSSQNLVEKSTGHVSSMTEGSKFIVPCVEVESVAADTLSGDDSECEMDVSFSDAYISVSVLSPLPLSPVNIDTQNRSIDTPLSPLPVSPSNELSLSPLPQSPTDDHCGDITLSPLPPSPTDGVLQSCVVSPLPCSPVSNERSKVITPLPDSPISLQLSSFADSAPLHFADTAPQGLKVPTPCNVVVMVTSQSEEGDGNTPTRSSLSLSDGSPFSPPPHLSRSFESVSSLSQKDLGKKRTSCSSEVEFLDVFSEGGAADLCSEASHTVQEEMRETTAGELRAADQTKAPSADKAPFIGPVLPAGHPLNQSVISSTVSKGCKKQVKMEAASEPVATSISPSFDDLLQSFQLVPRTRRTSHWASEDKSSSSSRATANKHLPNTSPLDSSQAKSDSCEQLPPSKRPKLESSDSEVSSPLLCSPLPLATPVQALPGYQAKATPTTQGPLSPGYQLRSRQVDFYQTVRKRKKSSSSSSDESPGPSKKPAELEKFLMDAFDKDEKKSDFVTAKQKEKSPSLSADIQAPPPSQPSSGARTADLSEGEVESDEDKEELSGCLLIDISNTDHLSLTEQRGAEPTLVGRKRRHTDGATGQEEDQTPANSPLHSLSFSPSSLTPPDLSKVNCGYGPSRQVERKPPSGNAAVSNQAVEDIFSTTIPLLGKSQPIKQQATPPAMPTQNPNLSVAQQQLPVWLQCPLPLPSWLVVAMTKSKKSQATVFSHGASKKRKGRSVVKDPIGRQKSQKLTDYILANLERLVLGQIHLAAIITMFSNVKNVSSSRVLVSNIMTFLLRHYLPSIDAVVQMYHDQCDAVRASPLDSQPLDPSFTPALLKPECQLLALFAHLPQMNNKMSTFLSELNNALYQSIVTPGARFHQLAAAIRLFTGVCRLQGDSERVLFMTYDLMRKPLLINELPVIAGVASVWPLPLARRLGLKLQPGGFIDVKDLEKQILSYSLEVVVMTIIKEKASELNASLSPHMHTLCGWVQVTGENLDKLVDRLLHLLNTSSSVYIDHPPPPPSPWRRPRPSVLAFHIVHSLRLVSHYRGWVWTNDTLIRSHLWPFLQKWNNSEGSEVKDAAAVCIVRLIGFVSMQGVTADPLSSSITQLQRVLTALVSKTTTTHDNKFLALHLAAVDSLLELCPPTHPRAAETVGVVRVWLNGLYKPAVTSLVREFNERLSAYRTS